MTTKVKKETKVQFTFKKVNPAFLSDTQKPKASIITCGTCHCSGAPTRS